MPLDDRITIPAPAATVWPYVADPVLMAGWNPKLVEVDRDATGPVREGERFQISYRLSGRASQSMATVVEARPPRRLVLRHVMRPDRPDETVLEEYSLTEHDGATTVEQRIHLGRSGMPWWARPLFWLVHRFGRPVGQTHLEKLRELVEADRGADGE